MTNPLTFEQLRDVRDQLRQPLSGRSVLVPLGTKAFVPGFLQPDTKGEEEMVTLVPAKSSGATEAITMSRTEALDRLQDEMDQISNRKKAPPPKETKPTSHHSNILPYFEIREEIDASGNELKAEAVNVSQHLEYLRQHPEVVQEETLPPAVTVSPTGESVEEIPVSSLKPLSDGEYDALAARLEDLARLEEAETRQPASKVMKKSNQKSGWNKGFLNKSDTSKKKPVTAPPGVLDKEGRKDPSETLIQSTSTKKDKKTAPVPAKPISKSVFSGVIQENGTRGKVEESHDTVETPSRVRFGDETNEIREIPRIGQTSVASLVRNPSRPIVGAGSIRPDLQMQQSAPIKKLSRFAMERQQWNHHQ
jgi:hypothetical protein